MSRSWLVLAALSFLLGALLGVPSAEFTASDPGVRNDAPGAGGYLEGLTERQIAFFEVGKEEFEEVEDLEDGVGPRFNFPGCGGCHSQPATGGTSPAYNPQVDVPKSFPGNILPSFIAADGPVREARFKYRPDGTRDGGVHALFVITGGEGADGCEIKQEIFEPHLARNNVIFRIPTPTFGAGLIEQIPDSLILANRDVNATAKRLLGIGGRANRISGDPNNNGNDGTIARFGWKAQNKSLLLFSGEAYNVEMGITNELFQTERDETPSCQFAKVPNSVTETEGEQTTEKGTARISAIESFAFFMRFLAPPMPSSDTPGGVDSINRGRDLFGSVGCALCHTPTLQTGDSVVEALRYKDVNLYSDLLVHNMGPGLADDIFQGGAGGDEFRTAPLWGLGQRIFFLHDGRTTDLIEAIRAHRSGPDDGIRGSEANKVVKQYERLSEEQKQDLLNFLRSL
jgi:CxxC motif-containing protein (DUF1111 family)